MKSNPYPGPPGLLKSHLWRHSKNTTSDVYTLDTTTHPTSEHRDYVMKHAYGMNVRMYKLLGLRLQWVIIERDSY